ncbi:hypothetical protein QM150_00215 [Klebsiella pneumoniae]
MLRKPLHQPKGVTLIVTPYATAHHQMVVDEEGNLVAAVFAAADPRGELLH